MNLIPPHSEQSSIVADSPTKNNSIISLADVSKVYRIYSRPFHRIMEVFFAKEKKKYHQEFHALRNVSLEIEKGRTIGIIGKNGSGKSTLLQLICGILQPTSGTLRVQGRISALLELGAGFNPQFTGRENVYLNASIIGMHKEEIDACFDDIASFADIGDFIDQPVKTYSSGMYVRLAFAVAINVRPDILVVDEALSVGDTLFQAKCFAKFKQFQEQGVTILFVTHSLDLITRYCSWAYLLDKGRLVSNGAPKGVVDQYNRLLTSSPICEGDGVERQAKGLKGGIAEKNELDLRENEERCSLNPDESRYGNGRAEIRLAGIYGEDGKPRQSLVRGEKCFFRISIWFHDRIEEPIYSFTIKDVKGFDISGTNTLYHGMKTEAVAKGQCVRVSFEHIMPLNPGGYLLSFGCAGFENGEYVVYERRFDLICFDVVAERPGLGFVDLDSRITIESLQNICEKNP